jgi:hypothetical protein
MKYMLLVYDDEVVFDKIAKEEQQEILAESVRLTHEIHANKQYLSASPLQPAASAAVVRVRQGKPFVTDGPFVETREQIAGYFLNPSQGSRRSDWHRRASSMRAHARAYCAEKVSSVAQSNRGYC